VACIVAVGDIDFMPRAFLGDLICFSRNPAPFFWLTDVSGMGIIAQFFECQRLEPSFGRKKSIRMFFTGIPRASPARVANANSLGVFYKGRGRRPLSEVLGMCERFLAGGIESMEIEGTWDALKQACASSDRLASLRWPFL
jgi:hypothetical protein